MDWMRESPQLSRVDTRVFQFEPRPSTVLLILPTREGKVNARAWELSSDEDWLSWLDNEHAKNSSSWKDGVCIILGGRAKSIWPDAMLTSRLPFSEHIFNRIAKAFHVHSSIARVIIRNTTAHWSRHCDAWSSLAPESIVYNCRSAASWPEDIALSATYLPGSRFTFGIFYGCTEKISKTIVDRISSCELQTIHPLTLPTLFADIERDRHVDLVEKCVEKLMQRVLDIGNNARCSRVPSEAPDLSEKTEASSSSHTSVGEYECETVSQWQDMNYIRKGLEDWKVQLKKSLHHIAELDRTLVDNWSSQGTHPPPDMASSMQRQGVRIKERLEQIIEEYDDKIGECTISIHGMSFATQMEENHIARKDNKTNIDIAQSNMSISTAAQRDSSQMRSIALLTMIFLPGTFVATLFSMTFFDWRSSSDVIMSPYIWVYAVVTVALTTVTVAIWRYWTGRRSNTVSTDAFSV